MNSETPAQLLHRALSLHWRVQTLPEQATQSYTQLSQLRRNLKANAKENHVLFLEQLLRESEQRLLIDTRYRLKTATSPEPNLLRAEESHIPGHFDGRDSAFKRYGGLLHGGVLTLASATGPQHYLLFCTRVYFSQLIKKIVTRPLSHGEVQHHQLLNLAAFSLDESNQIISTLDTPTNTEAMIPATLNRCFYHPQAWRDYQTQVSSQQIGYAYSTGTEEVPIRNCCALLQSQEMLNHIERYRRTRRDHTYKAKRLSYAMPKDTALLNHTVEQDDPLSPYYTNPVTISGPGVIYATPYIRIVSASIHARPVIVSYTEAYRFHSSQQTGRKHFVTPRLLFIE